MDKLTETKIISAGFNIPNFANIEEYVKHKWTGAGTPFTGYEAARKAVTSMTRDEIITIVKDSGLRGKGGAGFPTGLKMSFMPKEVKRPHYLLVNCDESEPGTCNDREIITWAPHILIEGIIIESFAIAAQKAFIYIRGEMYIEKEYLQTAVDEAYAKGFLGKGIFGSNYNLDIVVHGGAGAYVCGEETAQISSLLGERGQPRMKPPFPAQSGVYHSPTTVNNVQTVATIPSILLNGADWHRSMGSKDTPGPRMFCVSGHLNNPGHFEFPFGISLRSLIFDVCGGIKAGKKVKAVIPGGSSVMAVPGDLYKSGNYDPKAKYQSPIDLLDTKLTFEDCAAVGTAVGSGAVIVMDETVDMVWALHNLTRFYAHESCGKCTPCREGVHWMLDILTRILNGHGLPEDPDLLWEIADNIEGKSFCPLGDAAAWPVKGILKYWRNEFDEHIAKGDSHTKVFQPSFESGLMSLYDKYEKVQTIRTHSAMKVGDTHE